jgi:hypothetical protein
MHPGGIFNPDRLESYQQPRWMLLNDEALADEFIMLRNKTIPPTVNRSRPPHVVSKLTAMMNELVARSRHNGIPINSDPKLFSKLHAILEG